MKRVLLAITLALTPAALPFASACNSSSKATTATPGRTLASFEPFLTRTLTPAAARQQFGAPDEETGSGLRIYKYRLDDGRTLWLGFPGDRPITYAKLETRDGTITDLTLR